MPLINLNSVRSRHQACSFTIVYMNNIEKVAVLVDNQNIYYSARNLYGGLIDYKVLVNHLVGERHLVRVSAFVVRGHSGQEPFFDALRNSGVKLQTKKVQILTDGSKKGDWDVGIAIEAVIIADHVDTIVIVSGDGDFVPLVRYLKNIKGKRVEAAAFGRNTSMRLKAAVDKFCDLELLPDVILKPRDVVQARNYLANGPDGVAVAN